MNKYNYLREFENSYHFDDICETALKKDGLLLEFVKNQTDNLCLLAVKQNGLALQFVKKQNKRIIMAALKNNIHAFPFILNINTYHNIMHQIIYRFPYVIQHIKNPELYFIILAIRIDISILIFINNINILKLANNSINSIPFNFLKYVKNQTDKICLAAVRKNGWNIEFVKNQTNKICLAAVKQNGKVLIYVKNQTNEICLAAVKQNGLALEFVKNQTEEICLEAIKQNGYASKYKKN